MPCDAGLLDPFDLICNIVRTLRRWVTRRVAAEGEISSHHVHGQGGGTDTRADGRGEAYGLYWYRRPLLVPPGLWTVTVTVPLVPCGEVARTTLSEIAAKVACWVPKKT